MIGFEDHQPSKWKDGVFIVPAKPKPPAKKRPPRMDRTGTWLTKSNLQVSLPSGAVAVTEVAIRLATPTAANHDVAPPGYFEKLRRAVAAAPRLPEQSREGDPDFVF